MPHTPENCPIVERTMEDLEASFNEMLVDERAGGDCHKAGKFHESNIHAAIFPIKNCLRLSLLPCTSDWGQL